MLKGSEGFPVIVGGAVKVKQTQKRSHDFEAVADEALEAAREMPPGPERIAALKAAGTLRNGVDAFGPNLTQRGRTSA